MAHHRRLAAIHGIEPGARLFRRQRLDLTLRRQPQHLAEPGDQRRYARHQHPLQRLDGETHGRQFLIASWPRSAASAACVLRDAPRLAAALLRMTLSWVALKKSV